MKQLSLLLLMIGLTTFATAQYSVGDEADLKFELKNASNSVNGVGKMVNPSADFKNVKGFIVVFTCNHCPFSKAYEDRIIELHNEYAPKGYPVLAINPNTEERVPEDSYDAMIERAESKEFPFAYLHDNTQKIAETFGATRTPHTYIVQKKKGGYVVRYIGAIDDNSYSPKKVKAQYVEVALGQLLSGETVAKDYTRAVGCTIKWNE